MTEKINIKYLNKYFTKLTICNNPIFYLVLIGLLIRLVLAPYTINTTDVIPYYESSLDIIGGLRLYTNRGYSYPPGFGFLYTPIIKVASLIISPDTFGIYVVQYREFQTATKFFGPLVTSPIFNLLIKLPLIFADLAMSLVVYWHLKDGGVSDKKAVIAFNLLWFNPLVIWVSSVHGQVDILAAFFSVLAIGLTLKKEFRWAGVSIALGVISKMYPFFLIPIILVSIVGYSVSKKEVIFYVRIWNRKKEIIEFLLSGLTIGAIMLFPLFYIDSGANVAMYSNVVNVLGGGCSILFIAETPQYEWLNTWIFLNGVLVSMVLNIIRLVSLSIIAFKSYLYAKINMEKALLFGAFYTVLVWLVVDTRHAPHHYVWGLPFLVLIWAKYGYYFKRYILLSISLLLYYVSTAHVLSYLAPLSVYTMLISPEFTNEALMNYWNAPGILGMHLRTNIMVFSAFIAVLTTILCFFPNFSKFKMRLKEFFK